MNKTEQFLDYFDWLVQHCSESIAIPDEVQEVYNMLREQQHIEKPMFTENGLQILEYLQSCDTTNLKAKDIADGMQVSSRKISGSIRKLVSDGFVDKYGTSPVIYTLSKRGKNFNLEEYKQTLDKNC